MQQFLRENITITEFNLLSRVFCNIQNGGTEKTLEHAAKILHESVFALITLFKRKNMETVAIFDPVKSVAKVKIKCVVTKYAMIHGV